MADILCPNCKKNNPDFLDVCQFCQTPLKPEAMVHIGDKPTKKDTGELEPTIPEWLRDIRQQSKDAANEESVQTAFPSKVQKNEPPDLLAGLASQASRSDDDEVPDWLANLSPTPKSKPSISSSPESETDFFAQFNKSTSEPTAAPVEEPAETNVPAQPSAEKDELSEWFSQASSQPAQTIPLESDSSQIEMGWMDNFDAQISPAQEPAERPKEEEDLSWLRDLEASSKRTGELNAPKQEPSNSSFPAASQEDLSWLNNLGGISQPSQSTPSSPKEDLSWLDNLGGPSEPSQPASPKEDLSWLNNLGGTPESIPPSKPSSPKEDLSWLNNLGGPSEPASPTSTPPSASQEDLSWLNNLGGTSEPSDTSFDRQDKPAAPKEDLSWLNSLGSTPEPSSPTSVQPSASQEDLGWLNNLSGTSEPVTSAPAQPSSSQEDLGWLSELSGTTEPPSAVVPESTPASNDEPDWLNSMTTTQSEDAQPSDLDAFSPRHTAPLSEEAESTMPDWLKSATEEPSLPLGVEALDQFREPPQIPATEQPAEDPFAWMEAAQETKEEPEPLPSAPLPATIDSSLFAPTTDALSTQDMDSLLSMDMPDWLSRPEPSTSEAPAQEAATSTFERESDDTLSPVELPSWVQAMRPVEAVAETTPSVDDQPTEREGPLAGLRGLIPIAPIGSARRPKPVSLKLQATDEQQASAALLEQILATETNPRTIISSSVVMSQNVLRWVLSGLLVLALSSMIFLRTQSMPVSPVLPLEVGGASSAVANIPENSHVLVVVDYEPSLAGEMEAISGPVLDQIVLLHHPRLSFLSTSPNGSALTERLLANTNISKPSPNGLGYNAGEHYFNLGYLPGGAAGVWEFIEAPQVALPSSGVTRLSDYSAVIVLTDHAESGRVWVEQLQSLRQTDPLFPSLVNQPLLMVSSAQAGPLLQPYVSSGQITGMINGLSDAARYEFVNNSRPGIARAYWDTFGVGLVLAIAAITLGSLWSLFTGLRARRAEAEQG